MHKMLLIFMLLAPGRPATIHTDGTIGFNHADTCAGALADIVESLDNQVIEDPEFGNSVLRVRGRCVFTRRPH